MKELIDKLAQTHSLSQNEWEQVISADFELDGLFQRAGEARKSVYGSKVFARGLIEISSYCKNDCYYCGIRRSNHNAQRYRLTKEEILMCCAQGYALGFRTFVLQGGENPYHTKERICDIVSSMKKSYPDCAVTLSLGERDEETYRAWHEAGADRYLLRHETADELHYEKIHPKSMRYQNRMNCLEILHRIGYQTGCGFMVESPYQTAHCLAKDMQFITAFQPEMVGIGPFIPHRDTKYKNQRQGSLKQTLKMIALTRLALPHALIPATTALGTIDPRGRELGLCAGANVVMPNLSPEQVRGKYALYDHKLCTGKEAAEGISHLAQSIRSVGYHLVCDRGDYIA